MKARYNGKPIATRPAPPARPVHYMVSRRTRADLVYSLKLGVMLISFAAFCAFIVWGVIYSLLLFV